MSRLAFRRRVGESSFDRGFSEASMVMDFSENSYEFGLSKGRGLWTLTLLSISSFEARFAGRSWAFIIPLVC